MHELYELRDKLCKELKAYGKKEVSASSLTMVDTLAHAIKNLDKVIECEESEEQMYSGRPSYEGGSMRGSYGDSMDSYSRESMGRSYARGRGRYARRDSMGRYSGDDEITMELQELMRNTPDERTRQKIQSIISKMD